jgi:hypothetical protein
MSDHNQDRQRTKKQEPRSTGARSIAEALSNPILNRPYDVPTRYFELVRTGRPRKRRERNPLINDLRREVERWRLRDYERVIPVSRKLLQHRADPTRENRVPLHASFLG